MCLLIVNLKGTKVDHWVLSRAATQNPHGFGMTNLATGKTFRTLSSKHGLDVLTECKDPYVAHWRYKTKGPETLGNCHPAPIIARMGDNGPLLFMNGTLKRLGCENDSDTVHLARYLASIPRSYWAKVLALTEPRYAVVFPGGEVEVFNRELWTERDGVLFSNDRSLGYATGGYKGYKGGAYGQSKAWSSEGDFEMEYDYSATARKPIVNTTSTGQREEWAVDPKTGVWGKTVYPAGGSTTTTQVIPVGTLGEVTLAKANANESWRRNPHINPSRQQQVVLFDGVFGTNKNLRLRKRLVKAGGVALHHVVTNLSYPALRYMNNKLFVHLEPFVSMKTRQIIGELWSLPTEESRKIVDTHYLGADDRMIRTDVAFIHYPTSEEMKPEVFKRSSTPGHQLMFMGSPGQSFIRYWAYGIKHMGNTKFMEYCKDNNVGEADFVSGHAYLTSRATSDNIALNKALTEIFRAPMA